MKELLRQNFNAEVTLRLFHVSKIILSLATMYFNLLLLRFCQVIIIIIIIVKGLNPGVISRG